MKLSTVSAGVPASGETAIIKQTAKHIAYIIQRDAWLNSEPIMRCRIQSVPFYNKHLGLLKGKNLPVMCGKCGIEIREDVYVSHSGYCPDCLYQVNMGNKA